MYIYIYAHVKTRMFGKFLKISARWSQKETPNHSCNPQISQQVLNSPLSFSNGHAGHFEKEPSECSVRSQPRTVIFDLSLCQTLRRPE